MKIQEIGVWLIFGTFGVALVQSPWCLLAVAVGVCMAVSE